MAHLIFYSIVGIHPKRKTSNYKKFSNTKKIQNQNGRGFDLECLCQCPLCARTLLVDMFTNVITKLLFSITKLYRMTCSVSLLCQNLTNTLPIPEKGLSSNTKPAANKI